MSMVRTFSPIRRHVALALLILSGLTTPMSADEPGLDKFKRALDGFVKSSLKQQYNGKTSPRLVLFAPPAHENLHDRNLPDGNDNNKRLARYAAAMGDVAKANRAPFVDLFQ